MAAHDHTAHKHAAPGNHGSIDGAARPLRPLAIAAGIILAFFAVELTGALISRSLALLADAAHSASDVAALAVALLTAWLASRPHTARRTFGYLRMEVLAASLNGLALVAVAVFIFWEAVERVAAPPEVRGGIVSIVATGGLAANIIAGLVLIRGPRRSMNVRAALLHVGGDALGSAGAIVAGLLVLGFEWHLADPIISFGIGAIILFGAFRLLREAMQVLLEGSPAHVDMAVLHRDIERIPFVHAVHDIHTWTITSGYDATSAHVVFQPGCTQEEIRELLSGLRHMVVESYGIAHITIQVESGEEDCPEAHVPDTAASGQGQRG